MRLNTTKRMITVRQCWHGTNLSQKSNTLDKYANVRHNQLYMDLLYVEADVQLGQSPSGYSNAQTVLLTSIMSCIHQMANADAITQCLVCTL